MSEKLISVDVQPYTPRIYKMERISKELHVHGPDGIQILTRTSPILARGVIYIILSLLLALFVWSFIGTANLIITAEGSLEPLCEMRRVYVPIKGELIDMYVTEGTPVSRGDILARIKSIQAITAATDAQQAKIQLERIELEKQLIQQQKSLKEKELSNYLQQIKQKQDEYDRLKAERDQQLPAAQKHKVNKLTLQLEEALQNKALAKNSYEKYQRLYETIGHGGISRKELEEKENQYIRAETAYQTAKIDLDNLDFEFNQQLTQTIRKLADAHTAMLTLRQEYDSKSFQYKNEEKQLDMQLKGASAAYRAASVITFDDLDDDNFLKVCSPVSGEVTFVASTQRGAQIKEEQPLISIAPSDAQRVVIIRIPDKDRGLLKVGQEVKLKFNAFPAHRYGFIDGTLEYISPSVLPDQEGRLFYEGRVSLEKDHVMAEGKTVPLRYGMTAKAEIIVMKRRIIDFAMDPFKKFKGMVE